MKVMFAIAAAVALFAGAAQADVVFDPETGIGTVAKGDIQSSFGDAAVTSEGAAQVTYTMVAPITYRSQCRKRPHQPKVVETFDRVRRERTEIAAEVVLNPQGKVTGWDLIGKSVVFLAGRFCPPGWHVLSGTTPEVVVAGQRRLTAFFEDQQNTIWNDAE